MSQVIAPINVHLHRFIMQAEPNLPECVQKFLYLVLSLQDDGNTQFALDTDSFYNKWAQKWNGLLKLYDTDSIEFEAGKFSDASEFKPIIESAIVAILKQKFESIIDWKPEDSEVSDEVNSKLFVASKSGSTTYLYIAKYFEAKRIIERTATTLFTDGSTPSESAIASCIEKIAQIHTKNLRFANKSNPEGKFLVNREQAEAIIRGQSENLIITGGPGTGKTTVVLYILWCMLESHPEYLDYEIYLAAPSGKAADRMRESLVGSLNEIEPNERENHADIFNKLSNLESSTIHRMLKYTPNDGGVPL
jgi:UvrD/REP helicase.